MTTTIGLYRPGTSVLHRLPAGVKLATLVVAGLCSILVRTPAQTAAALVVVMLGYAVGKVPLSVLVADRAVPVVGCSSPWLPSRSSSWVGFVLS